MNPGNKKNMQTIDIFTYSIAVLGLLLAILEVIRAVLYYNCLLYTSPVYNIKNNFFKGRCNFILDDFAFGTVSD